MSDNFQQKVISITTFKSKTKDGEIGKYYIITYNDGVVLINKYTLSSKELGAGFQSITNRFGKTLYLESMAMKYGSLYTIHEIVSKSLITNKIPRGDIAI